MRNSDHTRITFRYEIVTCPKLSCVRCVNKSNRNIRVMTVISCFRLLYKVKSTSKCFGNPVTTVRGFLTELASQVLVNGVLYLLNW